MKEKIYTIPINESYEQDTECPFCYLEKKLETEALEYALGAAIMEPDYRIVSNEKGYCNKHFSMLLAIPNKLSLALILETRLKQITDNLEKHRTETANSSSNKGGLFSKTKKTTCSVIADEISKIENKCVICDKINENINRYIDVFFYMWNKDEEFRKKVKNSKGFCLKHFTMICNNAEKKAKKPEEFLKIIYNLELENLKRIYEDIHRFTLKFDYRNKNMEWGTSADAPFRTIEKISGFTIPVKEYNK